VARGVTEAARTPAREMPPSQIAVESRGRRCPGRPARTDCAVDRSLWEGDPPTAAGGAREGSGVLRDGQS
jgi:hypothetical protein